ncbi:hypothetical protein LY76DRAFT_290752 [Colletotrichum caudatum]|nr:hypothetical protein LY76DRAFT_290752 [Colletotrichum caudatum]
MTNCAKQDASTSPLVGWPFPFNVPHREPPQPVPFDVISSTQLRWVVLCAGQGRRASFSSARLPTTCPRLVILPCFGLAQATLPSTLTYEREQRAWIAQEKYKCNSWLLGRQDSCGSSLCRHPHDPLASRHTCAPSEFGKVRQVGQWRPRLFLFSPEPSYPSR